MTDLDLCTECGAVVGDWSTHDEWHGKLVRAIRHQAQRPPGDLLNQLGNASIKAFIHSRAACVTCGHRRKDHDGPASACRRYDQPDCPCGQFIEDQEDE